MGRDEVDGSRTSRKDGEVKEGMGGKGPTGCRDRASLMDHGGGSSQCGRIAPVG